MVILFPISLLSSHVLCGSEQDDTEICVISISVFVKPTSRKTTYYERASRENSMGAGGASARLDAAHDLDLDLDLNLFLLLHQTDLEAHDDERDRNEERERPAEVSRTVPQVDAVVTRRSLVEFRLLLRESYRNACEGRGGRVGLRTSVLCARRRRKE